MVAGILWAADNGFKVANLSLGGDMPTDLEVAACAYAKSKGLMLVCAAGNTGVSEPIAYPARLPSCYAVGALDANNVRAAFSSVGPELFITAPGVGVLSTLPGGTYATKSGTSMATPHVTGAVALVLAAGKATTPDGIAAALARSATDLGDPGRDTWYGHGLVNAQLACGGGVANRPPTVNAGPDQTLTLGTVATLQGTVSDDGLPAGSTVTATWSKASGPGSVIVDGTTCTFSAAGSYVVRLTASDGEASASDTVAFAVAPRAGGPSAQVLRVAAIEVTTSRGTLRGVPVTRAVALVTVVDPEGVGVASALPAGHWEGAVTGTNRSSCTNKYGWVKLLSAPTTATAGTFRYVVDRAYKSGWQWDRAGSVMSGEVVIN
jgi:hypothetical protein